MEVIVATYDEYVIGYNLIEDILQEVMMTIVVTEICNNN